MAAAILKVPDLELDKEEARRLAEAAAEVGKHYQIALDPKRAAWLNLLGVAGTIYGPRIMAAHIRRKKKLEGIAPGRAPQAAAGQPAAAPAVTIPIGPQKANGGAPRPNTGPYADIAPSQIWPEPAADFPSIG